MKVEGDREDERGRAAVQLERGIPPFFHRINGIRRMIEEPRPCIDLLQQLAAAEAALARISHAVFAFHVEHCVPDSLSKGKSEQQKQLRELIDIFDRRAR